MSEPIEPTGVLASLAERRKQLSAEQVYTIKVPRWTEPELRIRFHPLEHKDLMRAAREQEKAQKGDPKKRAQIMVDTNADLLCLACEEVVAVVDGQERQIADGAPVTFDPRLAMALGIPDSASARAVCRELFITEADLLATARGLSEWSGYTSDDVQEMLAGES
jgi:hypothetical protein